MLYLNSNLAYLAGSAAAGVCTVERLCSTSYYLFQATRLKMPNGYPLIQVVWGILGSPFFLLNRLMPRHSPETRLENLVKSTTSFFGSLFWGALSYHSYHEFNRFPNASLYDKKVDRLFDFSLQVEHQVKNISKGIKTLQFNECYFAALHSRAFPLLEHHFAARPQIEHVQQGPKIDLEIPLKQERFKHHDVHDYGVLMSGIKAVKVDGPRTDLRVEYKKLNRAIRSLILEEERLRALHEQVVTRKKLSDLGVGFISGVFTFSHAVLCDHFFLHSPIIQEECTKYDKLKVKIDRLQQESIHLAKPQKNNCTQFVQYKGKDLFRKLSLPRNFISMCRDYKFQDIWHAFTSSNMEEPFKKANYTFHDVKEESNLFSIPTLYRWFKDTFTYRDPCARQQESFSIIERRFVDHKLYTRVNQKFLQTEKILALTASHRDLLKSYPFLLKLFKESEAVFQNDYV